MRGFTVCLLSYCIAAPYPSSAISQLSHDKNYCCANAVMYMYFNFFSSLYSIHFVKIMYIFLLSFSTCMVAKSRYCYIFF